MSTPPLEVAADTAPGEGATVGDTLPVAGAWLEPLNGHWIEAVSAGLARHCSVVRVLVVGLRGSAPRETGACMLVYGDGTVGTIGGGQLEWRATRAARELLCMHDAPPVLTLDLVLGPELGQCCGGRVELWLERFTRADLPWLREAGQRLRKSTHHERGAATGEGSAARGASGAALGGEAQGVPHCPGMPLMTKFDDYAVARGAVALTGEARGVPDRRGMTLMTVFDENGAARGDVSHGAALPRGGGVSRRLLRSTPGSGAPSGPQLLRSAGQITLFEAFDLRRPPLWIYGAGHVGQSLVRLLAELALFDITWIDSRPELLPADLPDGVTTMACAAPADSVTAAPAGGRYVVMTHDHALDYALCRLILRRGDGAWLGLIGSASKSARFRARLLRDGFSREALLALTCPIGIPGIASKLPGAIAIAIAAQLLQTLPPVQADKTLRADQMAPSRADGTVSPDSEFHTCTDCDSCGRKY